MSFTSPIGRVLKLVYSFADVPKDKRLLAELEKHLAGLQRRGLIVGWHREAIAAGSVGDETVRIHLQQADIILLLLSNDFIHSPYCYDIEMQQAMLRHQRGEAWLSRLS